MGQALLGYGIVSLDDKLTSSCIKYITLHIIQILAQQGEDFVALGQSNFVKIEHKSESWRHVFDFQVPFSPAMPVESRSSTGQCIPAFRRYL